MKQFALILVIIASLFGCQNTSEDTKKQFFLPPTTTYNYVEIDSVKLFYREAGDKSKPTIIALAPHIVEMLYDVGAGEQIIGTTSFADYPEQAKKIPRIGNYVRGCGRVLCVWWVDRLVYAGCQNTRRRLKRSHRLICGATAFQQCVDTGTLAFECGEFGTFQNCAFRQSD